MQVKSASKSRSISVFLKKLIPLCGISLLASNLSLAIISWLNHPFLNSLTGYLLVFIIVPVIWAIIVGTGTIAVVSIPGRRPGRQRQEGEVISTACLAFIGLHIFLLGALCINLFPLKDTPILNRSNLIAMAVMAFFSYSSMFSMRPVIRRLILPAGQNSYRTASFIKKFIILWFLFLTPTVLSTVSYYRFRKPPDQQRFMIIGMDGGTWDIINPMIDKGLLKNLAFIKQNGATAVSRSLDPPLSPLVWTSIATGKLPSKHGVFDFGYNANDIKTRTIWDIFDMQGFSIGLSGYLVTWPPHPVNGFIIPGWTAQGNDTYPPELNFVKEIVSTGRQHNLSGKNILVDRTIAGNLLRSLGYGVRLSTIQRIITFAKDWALHGMDYLEAYYRLRLIEIDLNTDVFSFLDRKYLPTLSIFMNNITDSCCHRFWKYWEPEKFNDVTEEEINKYGHVIPDVYREFDKMIGRLLENTSPKTTIAILSDHGHMARPLGPHGKNYSIKTENLLKTLNISDWVRATNVYQKTYLRTKEDSPEHMFQSLVLRLKNIQLADSHKRIFHVEVDEQKSIVLKVRGTIDAKENETVDLSDGTCRFGDLVSSKPIRSGVHSLDGILLLYGEEIKRGVTIPNVSILDVTPTILALAGLPVGADMDGKVLKEAIRDDYLASHPITTIPTYDIKVPIRVKQGHGGFQLNKDLQQKLKALGYVN
jgi:predicted AlkP superfamily phosphohydrolase/phosphomutase